MDSDSKLQDNETKGILFTGASISQLGRLFGRDNRTVQAKIHGKIDPVGLRAKSPIYSVKDAAPYLVPPAYEIEEYIKRMTHMDLPMELRKEFWAGRRSQQLFEKEQGSLVPIENVREVAGATMKAIRERILLTKERILREVDLPERAIAILDAELDELLAGCRDGIINQLEIVKKADETAKAAEAEKAKQKNDLGHDDQL